MIPLLLTLALQAPVDDPSPTAAARALIDQGEIEAAIAALEALTEALPLEETVRRYEALGIARALAGDEQRATEAYRKLLAIEPAHTLPYTLSPKATFPFERARQEASARAATNLRLVHDEVGVFDAPTRVEVELMADPEEWVSAIELCHGLKGTTPSCERRASPALGARTPFDLPAVPARDESVILQISLSAFDGHGQEIYRGPSKARPLELPVGYQPAGAWYSNPWIWVGVGVAATLGAGVAFAVVQPKNDRLRVVVP